MAPNSRVITALKKAAAKGKQVTVLVELKARFDEENNLHWVQELEEAGCYVSYGLYQLKTHSKALLIVKKEGRQIKQYVHLGTGNYNEKTASIYTDVSLFTAKKEYVEDITAFFNYLSGYRQVPNYQRISVSPNGIQQKLLEKIQQTIIHYQQTRQGAICFKMNSLTDKVVINKLYEASQVGVPIHLIVRGACCLKPGIPNLSETIAVQSIVGRFLEHSRIYAFYTNEKEADVWISSADIMTRNMLHRIEIATPIEKGPALDKLLNILAIFRKDHKKAYYLTASGHFRRLHENPSFSAQEEFMEQKQPHSETILPISNRENPNLLTKIRKIWQNH
ncbi:MAG TPA: phospholipase D-like domain-containing protein [Enterococcus sp.]|nr:phospholipase D-like domain-containing protein [Enterococcus sp.]